VRARPGIFGIINITEDSFSDGGRYLEPRSAIEHSLRLVAAGADVVDLGAAASNIAAAAVAPEEEIRRLDPVITALEARGVALSVDSFCGETQRYAIARGVGFLNDIRGFPDPSLYPLLARSNVRLVVMHAVSPRGPAIAADIAAGEIWGRVEGFFDARIRALEEAGIARDLLILDPGMGFFLSRRAEASLTILAGLDRLKERYRLPVLVSVSRKSFLGAVTGRDDPSALGAATLAAELHAAACGADFIRTHDPAPLLDALKVMEALEIAKSAGARSRA
jgi:dihydropteroate synthase type 2